MGSDQAYPFLKVGSWIETLDACGKLHRLTGLGEGQPFTCFKTTLQEYWRKFEKLHPDHEVFTYARGDPSFFESALPVYVHGDEGTTYKKAGCLCLSFHCPFGKGTLSSKVGQIDGHAGSDTNFKGHAFETRFLLGALLRVAWLDTARLYTCLVRGSHVYNFLQGAT